MIQKRGSGPRPWRARHKLRGIPTQKSFRTKGEAEEWMRAERETYAREKAGLTIQKGPITYDALAALFLDNYTAQSKGWLEEMLRYGRERFGKTPVHLLRSEQIGRWIHTELTFKPKTVGHILTAMRQVLNAGVEWGYLQQSPARPSAVRPPRGTSGVTPVYPLESWAQVLAVADAAGYYGPLIRFACTTGLRPQEWASLEWNDIDRAARVVNVRGTKTDAARRAVVLSKPALAALDDIVRRLDTPLVFTTKTGLPIHTKRWGQKYWRQALELAGLRHRPSYQMRHTFATLALAQGCTIEWVSKQLGHADIHITLKHYARFVKVVDERMRGLLDQIGEKDARQRNTEADR